MKKVFVFMAIAAMMCLAACNKDDNGKKDRKGGSDYEAPIKIDGQFDDWAALDATKVASATCAEDAAWEALKKVKVYADAYFVYIYFEWDTELIEWRNDPNATEDEDNSEWVPFHIYVNADGDKTTGGFSDQWTTGCTDFLYEGFLTDGNNIASYDPGAFLWAGEAGAEGWTWEAAIGSGNNLCKGAGVNGKYEIVLIRQLAPVAIADNFSIGFDIQQAWDSVGVLPNAAVSDDNSAGKAEMLDVVTDK